MFSMPQSTAPPPACDQPPETPTRARRDREIGGGRVAAALEHVGWNSVRRYCERGCMFRQHRYLQWATRNGLEATALYAEHSHRGREKGNLPKPKFFPWIQQSDIWRNPVDQSNLLSSVDTRLTRHPIVSCVGKWNEFPVMQIGNPTGICALQPLPLNGLGDSLERTDAMTGETTTGATLRRYPDRCGSRITTARR
jgi:hypothetical protein